MKKLILSTLLALVSLFVQAAVTNISTGIDNLGNAQTIGLADPNWALTSSPYGAITPVASTPHSIWFGYNPTPVIGSNAQWINKNNNPYGHLVGDYVYSRNIVVVPGTATLAFDFRIAYDDMLVDLYIEDPMGSTMPLTNVPGVAAYALGNYHTPSFAMPMSGTWKVVAKVHYVDAVGGFILSGTTETSYLVTTCLTATQDATIHEFVPTTNYGVHQNLFTTRWTYNALGGSGFFTTKSLIQFDLSSIPVGTTLSSATLTLKNCPTCYYNQHADLGGGTGNSSILKTVTSPWTESLVTWSTAPTVGGLSVNVPSFGNGSTADLIANVTAMTQGMMTSNNGFELSLDDNTDYYHSVNFATRENALASLRPELCITYTTSTPPCTSTATNASGCACTPIALVGSPAGGTFSVPNPFTSATPGTFSYTYTAPGCTTPSAPATITVDAFTAPTFITPIVTSSTTASISWTPSQCATKYFVWYRKVGGTFSTPTFLAPTTSYNITSLTPCTTYEIYIRSVNACGASSGWSSVVNFTTDCLPCGTPATIIAGSASSISWNEVVGATVYSVWYRQLPSGSFHTYCGTGGTGTVRSFTPTGMIAGQPCEVYIRNKCAGTCYSSDSWSVWSGAIPFTARPTMDGVAIESSINIFPNPTSSVLNIELNANQTQQTSVKVVDITGRLMVQTQSQTEAGLNNLSVDMQPLATGMYLVQIYADNKLIKVQKIEKN